MLPKKENEPIGITDFSRCLMLETRFTCICAAAYPSHPLRKNKKDFFLALSKSVYPQKGAIHRAFRGLSEYALPCFLFSSVL